MKIIISPYSNLRAISDGKPHPKNYPYWSDLIKLLKSDGHSIIQIGVTGEEKLTEDFRLDLKIPKLVELVKDIDLFISVDTFLPHMAHHYGKHGIVIFSQSDPVIFGYPENINILKDKKYLRKNQFWLWSQCEYIEDAFVHPSIIAEAVKKFPYNNR